jgi:hypothetical protein
VLKAFLRFLGAVDGEDSQMWFLLGIGAFMGFFLATYQVGTESLFIQTLGEKYLAESFFVTGALGVLSSVTYVYIQKKNQIFSVSHRECCGDHPYCMWSPARF